MNKIKLTKSDIDQIFEKSKNGIDYLINLYKFVVKDFNKVKLIDGFPVVSQNTACYIMDKVTDHKLDFMLLWLNKGFSSDVNLPDNIVNLSKIKLIYDDRTTEVERTTC